MATNTVLYNGLPWLTKLVWLLGIEIRKKPKWVTAMLSCRNFKTLKAQRWNVGTSHRRKSGQIESGTVELRSLQEKVAVLRHKQCLKGNEMIKNFYIHSAKSLIERLINLNFRTLLKELPLGKEYFLAGNGRLMKRNQDDAASGSRSSPEERRSGRVMGNSPTPWLWWTHISTLECKWIDSLELCSQKANTLRI